MIETQIRQNDGLFLCIFEHTCAYARWALIRHFASGCPSVTGPKFRLENNSYFIELIGRLTKDQEVTDILLVSELLNSYRNVFVVKFET